MENVQKIRHVSNSRKNMFTLCMKELVLREAKEWKAGKGGKVPFLSPRSQSVKRFLKHALFFILCVR
jgi:hypothetical protein